MSEDGELTPEIALSANIRALYPFVSLSGDANILVLPSFESASIATKLLETLGGAKLIGPILLGLEKNVQIIGMSATSTSLLNLTLFSALDLLEGTKKL